MWGGYAIVENASPSSVFFSLKTSITYFRKVSPLFGIILSASGQTAFKRFLNDGLSIRLKGTWSAAKCATKHCFTYAASTLIALLIPEADGSESSTRLLWGIGFLFLLGW